MRSVRLRKPEASSFPSAGHAGRAFRRGVDAFLGRQLDAGVQHFVVAHGDGRAAARAHGLEHQEIAQRLWARAGRRPRCGRSRRSGCAARSLRRRAPSARSPRPARRSSWAAASRSSPASPFPRTPSTCRSCPRRRRSDRRWRRAIPNPSARPLRSPWSSCLRCGRAP